jgi:hypothetical protein
VDRFLAGEISPDAGWVPERGLAAVEKREIPALAGHEVLIAQSGM